MLLDGATQIAAPSLAAGMASFSSSPLAAGNHSFTVNYSGDANFAASSSAAVTVTVTAPAKVATATSLSASSTQLTSGQSVTFSARVAPQSGIGVPTGSISFLDGSTQIGSATLSSGSASLTSAALAVGTHSITAAYLGDANYAASNSAAVPVTVAAVPTADYSLSTSSSSLTVAQGSSGTLTITVTPKNGFKQVLELACSGLPAGGNCSFNPQNVNPSAGATTATLTVQTPSSATAGEPTNEPFQGTRGGLLYILAMAAMGFMGAAAKRRGVTRAAELVPVFSAGVVCVALLGIVSCAGYSKPPGGGQPTSYVVTVTASGANAPTHTQQFTLNVKP
jgi:hypothetical protein